MADAGIECTVVAVDVAPDLIRAATDAQWNVRTIAARDAPTAMYGSTPVVVVDARDGEATALAATRAIGAQVAANGSALLVLVGQDDDARLDAFYAAGATHFLADPRGATFVAALRFAARHAARVGGCGAVGDRRLAAGGWPHDRDASDLRRWITTRISQAQPVGVVLTALSRLDIVNAAHGRPVGDALIEAAGARIAAAAHALFGDEAKVARADSLDFLLAAGTRDLHAVTARLGDALAEPFAVDGVAVLLGCRLGLATHEPGDDAAALLRRAGAALADAKASDGATMRVAEPDGVASIDTLAIDLHHAIERDEIGIVFQPQVEIASGRVTGVEALARWDHGTLGPLGAETLFAAAERADLGIALSDHIQQCVLARAAAWPQPLAGLRVSLNLTAADVGRPGFAQLFLTRVAASGFPRGRLTVEITESGLIADLKGAAALLAELRGAGCRVAIDDFGTGYSSLAYLKALPLDYLKIDKALTRDIDGSPRDRVVVRGVIDMARSLGFAVIAEGVETVAQRDLLAGVRCDFYQGFLFSEALGEAELLDLMEKE